MIHNVLKIWKIKRIYLTKPNQQEIQETIKGLDLHEMIEQDILEPNAHDKIDIYDDCIFLIIHFPKYNEKLGKHISNEMNIILGKTLSSQSPSIQPIILKRLDSNTRKKLEKKELMQRNIRFHLTIFFIRYLTWCMIRFCSAWIDSI